MRLIITIVALFSLCISGCNSKSGKEKSEVSSQKDFMLEQLNAHVLSIRPTGDKVKFITDGFGSGPSNQFPKESAVGLGEQFWSMQDHHGHASLVVKEIKKGSVVLTYQSDFDARSFGGKMKSEKRDLELPFKGKS